MNKIIINATSLKQGGGITILNQYFEMAKNDVENLYVFYVDEKSSLKKSENIQVIKNNENIYYKNKFFWNLLGFNIMLKKVYKNESPTIFSLQNFHPFGINKNLNKIVYLHQAIPFFDEKWSFFDKEERIFWFYKNIYLHLIVKSLNESSYSIVQTQWLKNRILEKNSHMKVKVEKPNVSLSIKEVDSECKYKIDQSEIILFYPASYSKYKNHKFLFEVLRELIKLNKNYKLYLTINFSEDILKVLKKMSIDKNVVFLGTLKESEMKYYYESAQVVLFPSKIESFGLPLIESKEFKKKIIVNNLDLYKEVIGNDYNYAYFRNLKINDWVNTILNIK